MSADLSREVDVRLAEIATLAQGLDDLLSSLYTPRHRLVVERVGGEDPPTRVTPPWPWVPKHVATNGDDQDVA